MNAHAPSRAALYPFILNAFLTCALIGKSFRLVA